MTPTSDPMAATAAEDAAEDDASFELVEVSAIGAARRGAMAARLRKHFVSGHLVFDKRGYARKAHQRLAIRSGPRWAHYSVIRRGPETVRLPFA